MKADYTFPKKERLTSKKLTEELFKKGSSVYLYPFRLQFLQSPSQEKQIPQVLFSVSKRYFKRAVDRNLIRRRMREAYRTSKPELLEAFSAHPSPQCIALVYVAKEKISFEILKKKLILVWQRMVHERGTRAERNPK